MLRRFFRIVFFMFTIGASLRLRVASLRPQNSFSLHSIKLRSTSTSSSPSFPDSQKHKYLGGSQLQTGPNAGTIYAVPSHSSSVLKITPSTSTTTLLLPSPSFPTLKFKFLRAVNVNDSLIIGLPCWSDSILKINTETSKVTTFGDSYLSNLPLKPSQSRWNWHGGQLSSNGYIYGVPANAERVLKVHPHNESVSLVGPSFTGSTKYYGGILSNSGDIYCIPYKSSRVLKIEPIDDGSEVIDLIGDEYESLSNEGTKNYSWHGGVHCKHNDCIYAFPSHASTILKIDCNTDETTLIGEFINSEYKWLGGTIDLNGNIWGVPSDVDTILFINTKTDSVREIETNFKLKKNKFQGAVNVGEWVYAIPSDSEFIFRINIVNHEIEKIEGLVYTKIKDKFQGAFEANNKIWFVPECYPCPVSLDLSTLIIEEIKGNTTL